MQHELEEQLDISVGHFNKEADQLEREKEMKQHLEKSLLHCEGHIELLEEEKQELGDRVEQLEGVNAQLREEMERLQRELAEMEGRFREELSLREEKIRELSVRLNDN
jgi:predicted RNase H-like nuclease (RuvC/YqgF family)